MGYSIATGWFITIVWNKILHDPGEITFVIGTGNINIGCQISGADYVSSGRHPGPYTDGNFNWPIPWEYSVDGVTYTALATTDELFSCDSSGTDVLLKDADTTSKP